MRKLTLHLPAACIGLACTLAAEQPLPAAFPLRAGFVWVYRGQVRWTGKDNQVMEQELQWRVRVVAVLRRKRQLLAQLEGWPGDLAWYEPGKGPASIVLIHDPRRGLHLLEAPAAQSLWARLQASARESVSDRDLAAAENLLPSTLAEGMAWGEPEALAREDGLYVRRIEEVGTQGLDGLGGWTGTRRAPFFRIAYRTHPDHTLMDFVPGLGFTRFAYVHHGTVSECDLKLVAIEAGRELPTGGKAARRPLRQGD